MHAITRLLILVAACTALAMSGCKKKDTTGGGNAAAPASGNDQRTSNDMKVIGLAFLNYCDTVKGNPFTSPMPADLSALEKFLGDNASVAQAIKDGTYKVFWGAPASQQIIACEKDAETKGGWVCQRMGSSQKMTAAEIQQGVGKK